ncbi:hypothetical protein GGI11_006736 [Coemansia sp. RSA 2049]|nr:hypothetical protein GGI11_006736 [Coemansia sp. RSA 2049]
MFYTSDRRSENKNDRLKYDMKEPQLDSGMANIFQIDQSVVRIIDVLSTGFKLSNGKAAYGPLLVVNNEAFTLKIPPPVPKPNGKAVNPLLLLDPKALAVLDIVTPKPEMIVVGGGAQLSQLSEGARKYLTSIGLKVEIANTRYASSTFNTLLEEGRNIAFLALPAGVAA